MTVHSLVLFENGTYTEISKEFDLGIYNRNRVINPTTSHPVEDHYMTFFCAEDVDKDIVWEYARQHRLHLLERWALPVPTGRKQNTSDDWYVPALNGYKMVRIHYWTDQPIHWELNPETDWFVCNRDVLRKMELYN